MSSVLLGRGLGLLGISICSESTPVHGRLLGSAVVVERILETGETQGVVPVTIFGEGGERGGLCQRRLRRRRSTRPRQVTPSARSHRARSWRERHEERTTSTVRTLQQFANGA